MKKLASAAVGIALCTFAWSSQAQETKFGDSGTLAIHAATGSPMLATVPAAVGGGDQSGFMIGATPTLGFHTSRYSTPEECRGNDCFETTTSVTSFYINPRIHYFVIENLSIGGEVLFATFSGSRETRTRDVRTGGVVTVDRDLNEAPTALGIMPMIGYNIRLGNRFSIWPHGGIGFRHVGFNDPNDPADPTDDVDTSFKWWFFNADVPFLLHIAPHFALGAGPGVTVSLSHSATVTFRGVDTTTSGWTTTQFRWFNAHLIGYF